jgi:hypothetical protein
MARPPPFYTPTTCTKRALAYVWMTKNTKSCIMISRIYCSCWFNNAHKKHSVPLQYQFVAAAFDRDWKSVILYAHDLTNTAKVKIKTDFASEPKLPPTSVCRHPNSMIMWPGTTMVGQLVRQTNRRKQKRRRNWHQYDEKKVIRTLLLRSVYSIVFHLSTDRGKDAARQLLLGRVGPVPGVVVLVEGLGRDSPVFKNYS